MPNSRLLLWCSICIGALATLLALQTSFDAWMQQSLRLVDLKAEWVESRPILPYARFLAIGHTFPAWRASVYVVYAAWAGCVLIGAGILVRSCPAKNLGDWCIACLFTVVVLFAAKPVYNLMAPADGAFRLPPTKPLFVAVRAQLKEYADIHDIAINAEWHVSNINALVIIAFVIFSLAIGGILDSARGQEPNVPFRLCRSIGWLRLITAAYSILFAASIVELRLLYEWQARLANSPDVVALLQAVNGFVVIAAAKPVLFVFMFYVVARGCLSLMLNAWIDRELKFDLPAIQKWKADAEMQNEWWKESAAMLAIASPLIAGGGIEVLQNVLAGK